jgi:hypothetical protein
MAITYTWEITDLKVVDEDPHTDAVVQTHWKKIGTNENGVVGEFIGATPLSAADVDPENFVPFEELTEELVLSWIQAGIAKHPEYTDHMNEKIQQQIYRKTLTEKRAPWLPPRHDPVTEYSSPAEANKQS